MWMPTEDRLLAYLAGHNVVTLATTSPAGPWAAAVFYASDGFDLIFLSAAHTRHAADLAREPRVAGTIQEDYRRWQDIQGIQLEGTARLLAGGERDAAVALYQRKFPFTGEDAESPIARAMARVGFYRLTPRVLHLIDNSRGFGHRESFHPPAPAGHT